MSASRNVACFDLRPNIGYDLLIHIWLLECYDTIEQGKMGFFSKLKKLKLGIEFDLSPMRKIIKKKHPLSQRLIDNEWSE